PKQNISLLISLSRWTALFTGIVYGVYRFKYLARREIDIQKHASEILEKHREKMAILKKQKEIEEMNALGRDASVAAK
ncbi:unnamed protein product, partial [Lymnaea stagnalis]